MKGSFPIVIAILAVFVAAQTFAQCTISGQVKDRRTGEALPFANVFLNHTSLGAATDSEGKYHFTFPPGTYELKVSYIGYETESRPLLAADNENIEFSVALRASKSPLSEVEIKAARDKKWTRAYRRFEREFLGTTPTSRRCTVTNPWVVDFEEEGGDWQMKASSSEPVEIINKSLGYKVHFYIRIFEIYSDKTILLGDARFEPLPVEDDKEMEKIIRNRKESYEGSERHLFKSLIGGHLEREGFRLYAELHPSKVVIRSPLFREELGKTVIPYTLVVAPTPGKIKMYRIPIEGRIEVHYVKDDPSPFYKDITDQVSWIEGTGKMVVANEVGIVTDPSSFLTYGHLHSLRVADMLPMDYIPGQ